MEPSFHDHEYLIIDEISYRFGEPKRGDIIVFRYPRNPQEYFIKRVVALPEERIEIRDGDVYIYNSEYEEGVILEEEYLPADIKTYGGFSKDIITLDADEYFVLGDNRNSSKDSRSFGPVKRSFITGRVLLRGWPFDKIGFFSAPDYQY